MQLRKKGEKNNGDTKLKILLTALFLFHCLFDFSAQAEDRKVNQKNK